MIDRQRMMSKMRELAAMFNFHIRRKEYRQAVMLYTRALHIAVFLELDEEQSKEFFGDGGYRESREVHSEGLFRCDKVEKAVLEACIKESYDTQKISYCEVMDMWREKDAGQIDGRI